MGRRGIMDFPEDQVSCIEKAVYSETRGVHGGPDLVVAVILNRTRHLDFPKTPCAVVYQKGQFSGIQQINKTNKTSKEVVKLALENQKTLNKQVLYFHNTSVKPKWAKHLKRIIKKGTHIFYGE
jgi:spore germination cell wall hydrolase CwlJ-like protein